MVKILLKLFEFLRYIEKIKNKILKLKSTMGLR